MHLRFIPFVVIVLHPAPAFHAILRADPVEESREPFAVSLPCVVATRVSVPVSLFEMRKFLRYERQITIARRCAKSKRACPDLSRTRFAHRLYEILEVRRIVGDAG